MAAKTYFREAETRENAKGDRFYLIDLSYKGKREKISSESMKLRAEFTYEVLTPIEEQMKGQVPQCLVPFLQIDMENFASETRSLTVMFVNLGFDLS